MTEPDYASRVLSSVPAKIAGMESDSGIVPIATDVLILDPAEVGVQLEQLDDPALDGVIEVTDNAALVNRLARIERGRRSEAYERKVTPGMTFSGTEKNRRSEERAVSEWYDEHDQPLETVRDLGWNKLVAKARGKPHVAQASGDNEWYTPPQFINAAVEVMGGIDLDPASTAIANDIVGATQFYTKQDDGLSHQWKGRIWLNPPYAQPAIDHFAHKLITEYLHEHVTEACFLTNNATETGWFQRFTTANAMCFPKGRIQYWQPNRITATGLQGQVIIYLGSNTKTFRRIFGQFGITVEL